MRELVRAVKASVPTTRIIVISGIEDTPDGAGSVSSGIDGIVLTMQPPVVLLATIHHVCCLRATMTVYDRNARSHRTPMDATRREDSPPSPSTPSPDASLTGREREIIGLIGQALSNKEIAGRLCISSITVRHHLTSIFEKFDVNSRQQLCSGPMSMAWSHSGPTTDPAPERTIRAPYRTTHQRACGGLRR